MKYKAIIFDLDGVICSTDEYHYEAWGEIAKKRKLPFDKEINHRLRGVSRMESLDIILENDKGPELSLQEKNELAEEKNRIYQGLLQQMTPDNLSKEVKETLDHIKEQGIKIAIGSSSKNARFILERLGLMGYFDAVSDGTMISKSKPDPEVFLLAASLLGISPEECLVVEDAAAGIQAAKAGGMKAAAIGDAVKSELADYRLMTFSELLLVE